MTKILKWLKERGYTCEYVELETWRYYDGFHKGGCYHTELYRVSNGMYIRAKNNGKKMYLLYKAESFKGCTQAGSVMLDFSQANFIARATQYFPKIAG